MRVGLTALLPLVALLGCQRAMGMETATPDEMGMDKTKLDLITKQLDAMVKKGEIAGAAYVVARGGRYVHHGEVGYMDLETSTPFRLDTICRLLSMTKPIGAVATMMLIERGLIKLDDPLYKYLPEWKDLQVYVSNTPEGVMTTEPAKSHITIMQLLTHTSGLSYGYGFGNLTFVDTLYPGNWNVPGMSMEEFSTTLAKVPLLYQPGTHWRYSYGFDILGCVAKKVTGVSPDAWLKQNLFDPLNMVDTAFYVPRDKLSRYATSYTTTSSGRLQFVFRPRMDYVSFWAPNFISLGAGIVSTARDYARFAQMLLNGGVLDGVRVLSAKSVDFMWRNHLTPDMLPMDMNGWLSDEHTGGSTGFTISVDKPILGISEDQWDVLSGDKRTGAIAWGGGAQTNWMANADADLVVTYMVQKVGSSQIFQDIVCRNAYDAITDASPRAKAGGVSTYTGVKGRDDFFGSGSGRGMGMGNGIPGVGTNSIFTRQRAT